MTARQHNGGPRLLRPEEEEAIGRLRAEAERLRALAMRRGESRAHERLGGLAMSTRFAPSRLRKCPTDRRYLDELERRHIAAELAAVRPQVDRLERKIARLEAGA